MNIQSVFDKIKSVSGDYTEPRPYITIEFLVQELDTSIRTLGPFLITLKKKQLIIFNHKIMTAVKLTEAGILQHHIGTE